MCCMQFNSVKVALFSKLDTMPEVFFSLFNIFYVHGLWNFMWNVESAMIVSHSDLGRRKGHKTSGGLFHTGSAPVEYLQE